MTSKTDEVESENNTNKKGRPIVVVVGAGSKHNDEDKVTTDNDGSESIFPPSVRWGLGGALALPFAKEGFHICLMGRRPNVLEQVRTAVTAVHLSQNHKDAKVVCVTCDVTDDRSVKEAFEQVISLFCGPDDNSYYYIDLVIFNVAPPYPSNFKFEGWGDFIQPHQIDLTDMNLQMDTQVNGLIRVCRQPQVVPGMIERTRGCILLSGESCCNLNGGFEFGSVAPARAALRSLGQSMFQSYGPMGIHVCNMNIGGIIDSPRTRTWMPAGELTKPDEIAEQFLNAYQQKPSVWSYEIQLSPGLSARKVDMRM